MIKCKVCQTAPGCPRYGGWVCPACAVFFRRFVLSPRSYKCKFPNDCGKPGREFLIFRCQACRLKACLSVGMKTDRIKRSMISSKSSSPEVSPSSPSSKSQNSTWAMYLEDLILTIIHNPTSTLNFINGDDSSLLLESKKRFQTRVLNSALSQRLELWTTEIHKTDLNEHEFKFLCEMLVFRVAVLVHKLSSLTHISLFPHCSI